MRAALVCLIIPSALWAQQWLEIQPADLQVKQYSEGNTGLATVYITQLKRQELGRFFIHETEVSCQAFLAVKQASSEARLKSIERRCGDYPDEPVFGVTYKEASDYCHSMGATLPTEQQWMSAVLYQQQSRFYRAFIKQYFIGDERLDYLLDVDDAPALSSGLKGMIGNVWEMTRTPWQGIPNSYVMKGGAFNLSSQPILLNPWYRAAYRANDITNTNVGFRCVK